MDKLVALLIVVAIAFLLWRALRGGGARCNWRRDPTHKTGGPQRYVCRRCGADAFTRNGAPPSNCHRAARSL